MRHSWGCSLAKNATEAPATIEEKTPAELEKKCATQELINSWTTDCLTWKRNRDEKRRIDAAAEEAERKEQRAIYIKQQEQKNRETQEREIVSMQADERNGYKNLTFEEFILDASKLQGTKIAIRGVYLSKGERLAFNFHDAAMWVSNARHNKKPLIPLFTQSASRETRLSLMKCSESPLGCALVVRGRVRMLTSQNAFGVVTQEFGVVVESVR